MLDCPTCGSQTPESSHYCPNCGTAVADPDETRVIAPTAPPHRSSQSGGSAGTSAMPARSSSVPGEESRFAPGTILASRYQVIGLLGKGGMGEVYRANDLVLGQAVALKFLPEVMSGNPAMLARFHGEVRLSRQVSHPNVCRVYDIGDAGGLLFLSMEYVDGEDLGSLLRRIGRLSSDKAVEFARKICAGLAAAHQAGILHRDLKPANIMIDSQGKVVLMDFGLAGLAGQLEGAEIRAGTPAYMAPEQLAGREVTVKSDIYSLGLVLYEMFAGRRPFEGATLAEMVRQQELSTPPAIAAVVKDIDPRAERVILRCLEPDPQKRPASALAVSAALPGGDPLEAALAAGETPSPDLVAASGKKEGIRPLNAVLCAAAVLILLAVVAGAGSMAQLIGNVPFELPPDALAEKARQYVRQLGYTDKPLDTAQGFTYDPEYLHSLERLPIAERWRQLRSGMPPAIYYWYRQSPRYLEITEMGSGQVSMSDPPPVIAEMKLLRFSPQGTLLEFRAVTNQVDDHAVQSGPVNWKPIFDAAALDPAQFKETQPEWLPLSMSDERKAWSGVLPTEGHVPVRIEAAAFRGKIVYAELVGPWSRPVRMKAYDPTASEKAVQFLLITIVVGVSAGATVLAWYNRRSGRGDSRGAARIALFGGSMVLLIWLIAGKHVPTSHEFLVLFEKIAWSLLWGGAMWAVYISVEPYVRRHWPHAIISWSRLLTGGVRDPLVGRDVLIGVLFGVATAALGYSLNVFEYRFGGLPVSSVLLDTLLGANHTIAVALVAVPNALIEMLVAFFVLFLLRALLRKPWLVGGAFVLLLSLFGSLGSSIPQVDIPHAVLLSSAVYFLLTRFGLVAYLVGEYVAVLLILTPMTADFNALYFGASLFAILFTLAIAGYGLHTALAGHSIIPDELL
jgi:serine/threonine-protein kinase